MLTSSEIRNAGDQSNRGLEIKLNEFFNINLLQLDRNFVSKIHQFIRYSFFEQSFQEFTW